MMKLNLGCGTNPRKGYVNLDYKKGKGVDIVHDMNKKNLPFKDNSFDHIRAFHVLEHINYPVEIIQECKRILKKGGTLHINLPHYSSICAYNPMHKTYWCADWMHIFHSKEQTSGLDEQFPTFREISVRLVFVKGMMLHNRVLEPLVNINRRTRLFYESALCWIFPTNCIDCILKK